MNRIQLHPDAFPSLQWHFKKKRAKVGQQINVSYSVLKIENEQGLIKFRSYVGAMLFLRRLSCRCGSTLYETLAHFSSVATMTKTEMEGCIIGTLIGMLHGIVNGNYIFLAQRRTRALLLAALRVHLRPLDRSVGRLYFAVLSQRRYDPCPNQVFFKKKVADGKCRPTTNHHKQRPLANACSSKAIRMSLPRQQCSLRCGLGCSPNEKKAMGNVELL